MRSVICRCEPGAEKLDRQLDGEAVRQHDCSVQPSRRLPSDLLAALRARFPTCSPERVRRWHPPVSAGHVKKRDLLCVRSVEHTDRLGVGCNRTLQQSFVEGMNGLKRITGGGPAPPAHISAAFSKQTPGGAIGGGSIAHGVIVHLTANHSCTQCRVSNHHLIENCTRLFYGD
jgi:hypothetical protein